MHFTEIKGSYTTGCGITCSVAQILAVLGRAGGTGNCPLLRSFENEDPGVCLGLHGYRGCEWAPVATKI